MFSAFVLLIMIWSFTAVSPGTSSTPQGMCGQLTTGAEFSKGKLLPVCEIESFSGVAQTSTGWNLRNRYILNTLKMLHSGFMLLSQVGTAALRVDVWL